MKSNTIAVAVLLLALLAPAGRSQTGPCATLVGPLVPDLAIDVKAFQQSIKVSRQYLSGPDIAEGYIQQAGWYTLLRFGTVTANIGTGDLLIGDPSLCPNLYEPSPTYGWRASHPTLFRLWTPAGYNKWAAARDLNQPIDAPYNQTLLDNAKASGELVATGFKKWSCLVSEYTYCNNVKKVQWACGYQLLRACYSDEYDAGIAGQYIIMTGVPKGVYTVEQHIDPWLLFPDLDRRNNVAAVSFSFAGK